MKIKKLIIILISLIMILNVLIPTVALAAEEVEKGIEDNTTIKDNEGIEGEEENTSKNESSDGNIQDETDKEKEENTVENDNENKNESSAENVETKENKNTEETQAKTKATRETIRGMLYLDTPTNGSTYNSSETSSITVRGWKMANASDTYIKAYVDNVEVVSNQINYTTRQDVINTIKDYGTAEQNPTPGFNFNINTSDLKNGEHTIKIDFYSDSTILATTTVIINLDNELHVKYRTHVEEYGWQDYVQDGETAGTSGEGLRLEAMNIQLVNTTDENINIKYQVHVQDIGWQEWKQNGEMAGTSNQSKRLEAIRIELENTEDYSVMYRVHVQDIGWQEWKTDGEMAGTSGQLLRLEAIEIKIVEKQKKGMLYLDSPTNGSTYYGSETSNITVRGWKMANASNTYIRAYVDNKEIDSSVISYSARPDVISTIKDYGTPEQNPTPGFNFNIATSDLDNGTHTIKIDFYYDNTILATTSSTIKVDKELHVQYRTHVEEDGWQDYVQDGEMAGTSGKSYRLEAINIQLVNNTDENINIKYQVHVQDIGWQEWKQNGEMAGTSNQSKRLEGIRIELENSEDYSIMYRVHVQDIGWQEWKTDGEMAGTSGQLLRLEAIEIKIVEKQKKAKMYIDAPTNGSTYYNLETSNITVSGWKMVNVSNTYIKAYIDNTEISSGLINYTTRTDVINSIKDYGTPEQNPTPGFNFNVDISNLNGGNHTIKIEIWYKDRVLLTENTTFYKDTAPHIKYSAHVEEIGWQDYVQDGTNAGTIGEALRIEALKIELVNAPDTAHVKYRAYVQGTGWTDYAQDGAQVGTTGQSKKIQAIQIQIEGLDGYVVEYQAHVQNTGWQPWAADGMEAGTTERNFRIEALKVRLTKEENSIVPQVKYSVHNSTNGWIGYVENGAILGNEGSAIELNAIKIALENSGTANIKYRVHARNIGWIDEVQNGTQAGTCNTNNGLEAIEIELEGLDEYSIEYRTYVIGKGWQDWVRDGVMSGTTGQDVRISAIQIRIVIKEDNRSFSNFSDIDESKYPGYKEKLQKLQNQHPNWIITLDYTGLDWNTVINNEDVLVTNNDGSVSAKSLTQYTNEWRTSDTTQYETGWYRASRAAIEYMIDPRNSLDEIYVFQFQDLTSSAGTYNDIASMISGTFLTKYEKYSTDSIINAILSAAETYNVSPYHLVSRIIQEQGTEGGSLNGYVYNEVTVYNLFNIGAYNTETANSIQNGAAYAYQQRWFTPETCIIGSARFLNNGYLARGQTTLYYQKYNVVAEPYYQNQYMTNIRAANDEGARIGEEYKENGLINGEFEFTIPVYENMPATPCQRPAT